MDRKNIITILLAVTLAFNWGNSLLSQEVSGRISDGVMHVLNTAADGLGLGEDLFTYMADVDGDGQAEPTSHIVRKMAHVAEFAVLGALLALRLERAGKLRPLFAFGLGVLTGAIDETIQLFSHRGSQLSDVMIDALGAALGITLALALCALARRRAGRAAGE